MRRMQSILAPLVTFYALAAGAASGADKVVTNKENGFEITIPESWEGSSTSFSKIGSDKGRPLATMTVGVGPNNLGITLLEWVESSIRTMANMSPDARIAEKTELKIGHLNAYRITYVHRIHQAQYVFVTDKRACLIIINGTKDNYDKYTEEIDAIVKSFKFIESK